MWEHLGQQLMVSQEGEINYEVAYQCISMAKEMFRNCEKATEFEKISRLFWNLLKNVKKVGIFFQIFVAFS